MQTVIRIAREHRIFAIESMVHAPVGRVTPLPANRRGLGVVRQAAGGWRRQQCHVLQRDRIEPFLRDDVAGERDARGRRRIENLRRQQFREVPSPHLQRREREVVHLPLGIPQAFVVSEEKCPVRHQRAAQAPAELMLLQDRIDPREEVPSIEAVVARKLIHRPMELVTPGLGQDVDDAAAGAAGLG